MDDLLIITKGILDERLQKMETVLTRLHDAWLKVNAAKSLFCAHEIEYLVYILTRDGIKPQPKKVQAILALNPPNNDKELRHFLRMVQYYRDMWARRSEMLAPSHWPSGRVQQNKDHQKNKTKKKHWRWDPIHQQAFDNVKAAIAKETVIAYPDFFLKPFEIYTDASATQLGAMIAQDNRPIAFFSRKLSKMQQKYSVTEIELLTSLNHCWQQPYQLSVRAHYTYSWHDPFKNNVEQCHQYPRIQIWWRRYQKHVSWNTSWSIQVHVNVPQVLFSDSIIEHYNLREKALNCYVYMEIWRGMYGLPQAGILANKLLWQHLGWHNYFKVQHMSGLWKHISSPIWFNLCVNYFGVKYIGNENLKHLFTALCTETYEIVEVWAGNLYCGINLEWN